MSNKTASEDLECAIPFCKRTGKEALIQSGEKRIIKMGGNLNMNLLT